MRWTLVPRASYSASADDESARTASGGNAEGQRPSANVSHGEGSAYEKRGYEMRKLYDFTTLLSSDDDAAAMRTRGLGLNSTTLIDQRPSRVRTSFQRQ